MFYFGCLVEGGSVEENVVYMMVLVVKCFGELLGFDVLVVVDFENGVKVDVGKLVLLENVCFNVGEKKDGEVLVKFYVVFCDVFVMDVFGIVYWVQVFIYGVGKFVIVVCVGILLVDELDVLEKVFVKFEKFMLVIVVGFKVLMKLDVLNCLFDKCDQLIVGGGIVNIFLVVVGFNVGKFLCEKDLIDIVKVIVVKVEVFLLMDVVVVEIIGLIDDFMEFVSNVIVVVKLVVDVGDNDMILDVGLDIVKFFVDKILEVKIVFWNGLVGVFEVDQFGDGIKVLVYVIVDSQVFFIVGGGDILVVVDKYNVVDKVFYIFIGGGVFLEYVEGKMFFVVVML